MVSPSGTLFPFRNSRMRAAACAGVCFARDRAAPCMMRLPQDEGLFDDFLGAQAGFGGESREMRLAVGRQTNFHNQPHIALDIRTSSHPPCP